MSTLYGTLIGAVARDYELQTSALHANTSLINRFGELVKEFGLTPHVAPIDSAHVKLVALFTRGQDHAPVLEALAQRGYRMAEPVKPSTQIRDSYTAWTVQASGHGLTFCLVYYIPQDVA